MCCCRLRRAAPHGQEGQLKLPGSDSHQRSREKLRQQFREGKLDDRIVEIDVRERSTPQFGIISNQNLEDMEMNLKDMLPNIFGERHEEEKDEGVRRVRLPGAGRGGPAHRHGLR
jgi:ATP-dependent HslUV protease ATP-binding subunit HslU